MFSRSKIISFRNIKTFPKYLSYWEDYCFSFSLKFVLTQFNLFPLNSNIAETATVLTSIFIHRRRQTQEYISQVMFLCIYVCIWTPLSVVPSATVEQIKRLGEDSCNAGLVNFRQWEFPAISRPFFAPAKSSYLQHNIMKKNSLIFTYYGLSSFISAPARNFYVRFGGKKQSL